MPARRSILVVDDEANARQALAELLRDEGYLVETANDGLAALAKLDGWIPDLVLTDIKMPGLDGIGLLRQIRERNLACPVILMTAVPSALQEAADSRVRAAAVLVKPLDLDELMRVLDRTLRTLTPSPTPS